MSNTRYIYQPPIRQRRRTLSKLEGVPERYLSPAWIKLRDEVLFEAGYECQECGGVAQTVHHTTYHQGLICDKMYLIPLCWPCHRKEHPEIHQDYL